MNAGPTAPTITVSLKETSSDLGSHAATGVLLGLLIFLLLCFVFGAIALARRRRRHVEQESAGLDPVELPNGSPADPTTRADWERDADWWKKSS
ncbi:hypothetical protein FEM03_12870 [Phragmitibacter flavus]|uniref:Uncharacterized protein n=1 Tax=Phragmitibacter flavus TaxID=2576071 RepID=A0A5R8KE68_9BACT|nr:hypothetical protein [Phragmitibacter flavus]TLD70602.1 hypothetical protein FEM03_12870 [Phragmitibacter flavus]